MGWLIALGVLILLLLLPMGISGIYDSTGPLVRLIVGPVRLTLYPRKKKRKKAAAEQTEDKTSGKAENKQADKQGGSIKDFQPLLQLVFDFLGDLRRKLRVDRLEMKLILAGGDPCDLALNYGKAWAALGNLMPRLEELFVIKKRDLEVECDFTSDQTRIYARLDLTITLGRILQLAVWHGFRLLREYLKIMNHRKGGAKT